MKPEEITAERIRQAAANQDVMLTQGQWYSSAGTEHEQACACPMMALALDVGLSLEDDRPLDDVEVGDVAEVLDLPDAWVEGFAWAWDNENQEDFEEPRYSWTDRDRLAFAAGYEAGSKVAEELAEEAG